MKPSKQQIKSYLRYVSNLEELAFIKLPHAEMYFADPGALDIDNKDLAAVIEYLCEP